MPCVNLRTAARELAGVVRVAEFLGWVGLQRGMGRAREVAMAARSATRSAVNDMAWHALTGSIRVSRTAIEKTRPARYAMADRLDRLAACLDQPGRIKGGLFRGVRTLLG